MSIEKKDIRTGGDIEGAAEAAAKLEEAEALKKQVSDDAHQLHPYLQKSFYLSGSHLRNPNLQLGGAYRQRPSGDRE